MQCAFPGTYKDNDFENNSQSIYLEFSWSTFVEVAPWSSVQSHKAGVVSFNLACVKAFGREANGNHLIKFTFL